MQALERRIKALERGNPNDHNTLIVIQFDEPGRLQSESRRISTAADFKDEQTWIQIDGESGDEFASRVHKLVRGNKSGPLLVFADHYNRS